MSNTPEGAVKDKIKAMLRTYKPHIYYFMPSMGAFGKSGVPDTGDKEAITIRAKYEITHESQNRNVEQPDDLVRVAGLDRLCR